MNAPLASTAFRLALRGLAVFPLAPGTKVHLSGTYRWIKNGASTFADAPAWLVNLALSPSPTAEFSLERRPWKSQAASELVE